MVLNVRLTWDSRTLRRLRKLVTGAWAAGFLLLPRCLPAQLSIENWARWEQTLTTTRDYHLNNGNPYRTLLLRVTYTPLSCSGSPWCQIFTGYGFWDGGRTFKIRSAFPAGTWSWQATCSGTSNGMDCSTDPALDSVLGGGQTATTATGSVTVYHAAGVGFGDDPYRGGLPWRGFVRISADGKQLTYGDGIRRFFWSADTAWAPAVTDIDSNSRWLRFLDDRGPKGFTVVMMAPAPSGDDPTLATTVLFEDVGGNCLGNAWPKSCSRWRPPYWQKLDEKVRLANERGLLVVLIGVMDPMGDGTTPKYPRPEDAAIFARNLAARLSGSDVIFSPSFDNPLSTTSTLMDWVGCALREAAPRHLVTAHLAGGSNVSDYQTVHNRRWHQLHVFQSGHAQNMAFANPWEDHYEYAVRRAREIPYTLYNTTTSGTSPACPNVPAISLPPPAAIKPNTNSEAAYDQTYTTPLYSQPNSQLVDTPQGVRHTGYSSTLNGAFGFTLGVKGIWDWTNISSTSLNSDGSRQMDILSDQFRLQPWQSLRWRSSWIKNQPTEIYNGQPEPEEDKQVVMAATSDNNFAMLYIPDNDEVKIDASMLQGFSCTTSTWSKVWVDPKDGQLKLGGTCQNISEASGATRRLMRPTCPGGREGDSGRCDWVVKLQRTGTSSSSLPAPGLEVWPQPTEGGLGWEIAGRVAKPGEGAQAEQVLLTDATQGGRLLKQPGVAADGGTGFFLVWEDEDDGDLHGIFLRHLDGQGHGLAPQLPVNLTADYDQTNPWVAASPAGSGVVTWTSYAQDGDLGGIFARLLDSAGVPFGDEIAVNESSAGHQDFSKVAMDAQGNFVVAWTSEGKDGDAQGVYARRFDRQGRPLGGEFRVNTTTAGAQYLSDLEVDPLGEFLVTWTSYDPDDRDQGLLGRRYYASGLPDGGEFLWVGPPS
jgi:Protein of unknown function (DUF4038)/Putative collagen-binding domain of a collagenase